MGTSVKSCLAEELSEQRVPLQPLYTTHGKVLGAATIWTPLDSGRGLEAEAFPHG
jgi:hypothetical protein